MLQKKVGNHCHLKSRSLGTTTNAWRRRLGKGPTAAPGELDILCGYAWWRRGSGRKTPAIDWDWSRSCGCVSTILRTIGFDPCRALSRRTNIKFSDASLITGPQPACWQPSLLGLCPILEHFAYWGFSFLVSGPPPKKRGRSYGGLGDWGTRICWPELSSFLLWKNVVMGALWASIIWTATMRFLWRYQQGKSLLQSISFFVIDVDIQQNAVLLNTIFSGAGSDHPCDASGSPSCCTLCNGEYRLICAEQPCSTGE